MCALPEDINLSEMLRDRRQLCKTSSMESMLNKDPILRYSSYICRQIRIGKDCVTTLDKFDHCAILAFARTGKICNALMACSST